MCAIGGIAGALGAAAVACAMVCSIHAEPVPYHAGDISLTQTKPQGDVDWFSTHADIYIPDANEGSLALLQSTGNTDGLGPHAVVNHSIEVELRPESDVESFSSDNADLFRLDDRKKAMQFPEFGIGDPTGLPMAQCDSHSTLIPIPPAVWSGAIGLCVAGLVIVLAKRHHTQ